MRQLRIKNAAEEAGYYHAICRTVGKEFLFAEEEEKRRLLLWLEKAVDFCGVEVRAWCLMSNHLHFLVKVPPLTQVSDEELDRRMRILYLPKRYEAIMHDWETWRKLDGDDRRVEAAKAKLRRRMYDISWFMKTFKQAVAQDYNARHDFSGSIWGGSRFKSVYLEGSLDVQLSVAAYIHLNPVRAGMVSSPEQYAWSSWGQACARNGRARSGLLRIYADMLPDAQPPSWKQVKANLEVIQTQDAAKTGIVLTQPEGAPVPSETSSPAPAVAQKLTVRAPEFSASPLLGSATFIRRYYAIPIPPRGAQSPRQERQQHAHRRLCPIATAAGTTICAVGTRSLGRSRIAYTHAK